jgi:hypothetical protein
MKSPMYQGSLECLCGIYSVLNALTISSVNFNVKQTFEIIVKFLNQNNLLAGSLTKGIKRRTISEILEYLSIPDIIISKPYWNNKEISLDQYWDTLHKHLASNKKNTAIICLGGKVWDHWTVATKITAKEIHCHDSELKKIVRSSCSTSANNNSRTHIIFPTHTFFISNHT